jgi:hypothetical protein
LKNRVLNGFTYARKHALTIGSTAATAVLFAAAVDVTNKDYENELEIYKNPPEGPETNPTPPWDEAVASFYEIANGTFVYDPMIISKEDRLLLQEEYFGGGGSASPGTLTNNITALWDDTLRGAYEPHIVNVYDLTIDQKVRRNILLRTRDANSITRERDSMTVAMLQYAQGSPLQKEALEHAELFYGIIMYQHMAMLPLDSFMDALLDSVVKYNDLKRARTLLLKGTYHF